MTDHSFGLGALAVATAMATWLAGCGAGYENAETDDDDVVAGDAGAVAPTPGASWSDSGPPGRKAADAGEAGAALEPVEAGASPEAAPEKNECTPGGVLIHSSANETSAWRYAANALPPEGFYYQAPVFRMAPEGTTRPHAPLYLLKNEANGDFLVSTVPTEGAAFGYGVLSVLGDVFLEQVPGSVPLLRYVQEEPLLRHRVTITPSTDPRWREEPPRGYVCPR